MAIYLTELEWKVAMMLAEGVYRREIMAQLGLTRHGLCKVISNLRKETVKASTEFRLGFLIRFLPLLP
jgi:DNA-binding CsgD family transcriptional regulator